MRGNVAMISKKTKAGIIDSYNGMMKWVVWMIAGGLLWSLAFSILRMLF